MEMFFFAVTLEIDFPYEITVICFSDPHEALSNPTTSTCKLTHLSICWLNLILQVRCFFLYNFFTSEKISLKEK